MLTKGADCRVPAEAKLSLWAAADGYHVTVQPSALQFVLCSSDGQSGGHKSNSPLQ
jgi:hypothetical protein